MASFNIDDIDVDELLSMMEDEVEQQALNLALATENNRYGSEDPTVPVASETGPSQSSLSVLSSAACALASSGGDGDAARQLDAARDQDSLNPGA